MAGQALSAIAPAIRVLDALESGGAPLRRAGRQALLRGRQVIDTRRGRLGGARARGKVTSCESGRSSLCTSSRTSRVARTLPSATAAGGCRPGCGRSRFRYVPVVLLESRSRDVEERADRIAGHKPDVVGLSVYVWSSPTTLAVARALRSRLAHCHIVLGGPSARAEMLALALFRDAVHDIDAVVLYDGERVPRHPDRAVSGPHSGDGSRPLAASDRPVRALSSPRAHRESRPAAFTAVARADTRAAHRPARDVPRLSNVLPILSVGRRLHGATFSEAYLRDELGAIKAQAPRASSWSTPAST